MPSRFVALFILTLLFSWSSWALENCESGHQDSADKLSQFGCNLSTMTAECKDWFSKPGHDAKYSKDCQKPGDNEVPNWLSSCGGGIIDGWTALFKNVSRMEDLDHDLEAKQRVANQAFYSCNGETGKPEYPCCKDKTGDSLKTCLHKNLDDVSGRDLTVKRENVRMVAARDAAYRSLLIKNGVPDVDVDFRGELPDAEKIRSLKAKAEKALANQLGDYASKLVCYSGPAILRMHCFAAATILNPAIMVGGAMFAALRGEMLISTVLRSSVTEGAALRTEAGASAAASSSTATSGASAAVRSASVAAREVASPGASVSGTAGVAEGAAPTVSAPSAAAVPKQPASTGPTASAGSPTLPRESARAGPPPKATNPHDTAVGASQQPLAPDVALKVKARKSEIYSNYKTLIRLRKARDAALAKGESTSVIDSKLAAYKPATGKVKEAFAVSKSAAQLDEVVIVRVPNEASYEYWERTAHTKGMEDKIKTAREGEHAGLLADPNGGELKLKPDGRPITSDLDIKVVLRRTHTGKVEITPEHGYETSSDRITRQTINANFKEIDDQRAIDRDIIRHGPEQAHPELSLQDNVYPLRAYLPNGDITLIEDDAQYSDFVLTMQRRGYFGQSAP